MWVDGQIWGGMRRRCRKDGEDECEVRAKEEGGGDIREKGGSFITDEAARR